MVLFIALPPAVALPARHLTAVHALPTAVAPPATTPAPPAATATVTFTLRPAPDGPGYQLVATPSAGGGAPAAPVTVPATPAAVAGWWGSLPTAEQADLEVTSADVLRNLDGLPVTVRDRLNRAALNSAQADLTKRVNSLADNPPKLDVVAEPDSGFAVLGPAITTWQDTFELESQQLEGIRELQQALAVPGTYLIEFDLDGRGHVALAYGDPDTAQNVAVIVPGTDTDLTTVAPELDHVLNLGRATNGGPDDPSHPSRNTPSGAEQAATLPDERRRGNAGPTTAVVEWIGYDTPYSLGDATSTRFARDGVPAFTTFMNGLATTHQGTRPHLTVIGHSYGSLLVGLALTAGDIHADDVVFVGSPGVGVNDAADLGMDPRHVWAALGDNDWVKTWALPFRTPTRIVESSTLTFGPDPHSVVFGAQSFAAGAAAHSDYFDPAYPALANMAAIVVGDYSAVTPAPPSS